MTQTRATSPNTYDRVMVGSSPCHLLEACACALAGANVAIVDSNDNPGGAWRTVQCKMHRGVELAPHYFHSNPATEKYMAEMGFEMETLGVNNFCLPNSRLLRGILTPIRYARAVMFYEMADAIKSVVRARFSAARKHWRTGQHYRAKIQRYKVNGEEQIFFPKCGNKIFIDTLVSWAKSLGVIFYSAESVCAAEFSEKSPRWIEMTLKSDQIRCKTLMLTRHSRIDSVNIDGESISLEYCSNQTRCVQFLVETREPARFVILSVRRDPLAFLKLLSPDLGRTDRPHELLYAASFRVGKPYDRPFKESFDRLKFAGAFPKDAKLIHAQEVSHDMWRMDQESVAILRERGKSCIHFTYTDNITVAIDEQCESWKSRGLDRPLGT